MPPDGARADPPSEARARSELRFRAIIDGFADPIVSVDGYHLIRYANAAVGSVLGYRAADLLARPFGAIVHPDDREAVEAKLAAALRSRGTDGILEHRVRREDGAWELVETTPNTLEDPTGRPVLVLHLRCVTERRRLEAQLHQRQKMETVGQLAGGVAHDFNNLLTVINGTAELAMEDLPPGHPLREALEAILEAGTRAAALTAQLLAFGRKQIVQPAVLDLDEVISRFVPTLRRLIGEHITIDVQPTLGLQRVRADRSQMEQIVLNLAINARDAMPTGGTLTLRTGDVLLDATRAASLQDVTPGSYVQLTVTDTGCGMDEATRERIFEPFFTTKGPGKGSGLGLATVHGIVKRHGGDIACSSAPGRGTTFIVHLPCADRSAEEEGAPDLDAGARGTETIVVVDDDEGLRRVARRILRRRGYTVIVASSGEEALELMAHHEGPIHLLLTDVVMPGMSGRDLAERVVTRHPGTKVLYASGYTEDSIVRHGVPSEGAQLVTKPYSVEVLLRKVRKVLDG